MHKNNHILLLLALVLFTITGCQQNQIQESSEDILKASIEKMQAANSYVCNTTVNLIDADGETDRGKLTATITYHREPFSYSNLQEMQASSNDISGMENLDLSLYVKDEVAYMYNSITGFWINDDDKEFVDGIKELANILDSFSPDYFVDLEDAKMEEDKIVIEGNTNGSGFLFNLMQAIEKDATGTFQMIIDEDTNYIESFFYNVTIDSEGETSNYEIELRFEEVNNGPEVVIPESALK
ncbi:hypothetical protein F8154_11885 [Alkaliphilus pronyensis]|uniref:LppX_LprAFG lipoprotein n=1 Tax=Alkaliphilus pronyensis TaxID=1482732 RepID=A0A6I0EWV8_9FIRM|nr:DUF6612 family protein [Alkaliphilus pronyensis]KAB3532439.1 hypothetical protein F8154_11885 [Alkaliphilus pronyensis]